jgi:hypothetical protein
MFEIRSVDGLYADSSNYFGQATNLIDIRLWDTTGSVANVDFDGFLDGAVYISDYGFRFIRNLSAEGVNNYMVNFTIRSKIATFNVDGILVETPQLTNLSITGGSQIDRCSNAGINIVRASRVHISDSTIWSCGTAADLNTGGIRYTSDITYLKIDDVMFVDAANGSQDIIAVGYPSILYQDNNSTNTALPIPVITSSNLNGVRAGITSGAKSYEIAKVDYVTGTGGVVEVVVDGVVSGVAYVVRKQVFAVRWTGATWTAVEMTGVGFSDPAVPGAGSFNVTPTVTGTGVTFTLTLTPTLANSQYQIAMTATKGRGRLKPGTGFI